MRKYLIALSGAVLLASAGTSFAQSQQGGYLGLNPGANVAVSHRNGATSGSGQGGYLGMTPASTKGTSSFVAPTDPGYAANGAPRAGAPAGDDSYMPIEHQHSRG